MKRFLSVLLAALVATSTAHADTRHFWSVSSPTHEQTFSDGMEQGRVWMQWARHLTLKLQFTNDPFVDWEHPREYDLFFFHFPGITLGKDGHTFYYPTPSGRSIPVATKMSGFLGIAEVKLLPNARVVVDRPNGAVSVRLDIVDPSSP